MKELGYYDFHNDFSISIDTELNEADTTIFHEMTHMFITLQSGYGNFLTLVDRGCDLYPKYSYVKQFFMKHMLKLQEAISTFAELVMTYIAKGVDELEKRIDELKFLNKKYYNYTYPLLFLFSFVDSDYLCGKNTQYIIPREQLFSFIFTIAVESLNVDLSTLYSVNLLENKKRLKRTENNPRYSSCFPNRRFYKAIQVLGKQLHLIALNEYTIESFETIKSNVYKSVFGSQPFSSSQALRLDAFLAHNKELVENLFRESPDYYTIYQNIEKIKIREIPVDRLRAYAMPSSPFRFFRSDEKYIFSANDFKEKTIDAFFILGDNTALHMTLDNHLRGIDKLREESDDFSQRMIAISRFVPLLRLKSKYIIMHAYNYRDKIVHGACIDKKELLRLNDDVPIIVNYKYYDGFRKIHLPNRRIYYYCDRVYENAIALFNSINKVYTLPYSFLQYDGSLSLFVIKLKNNAYYFLPIVTPLIYLILEDMDTGKLLLKKENIIELNSKEIYDFDVLINCLYCTNPNASNS